MYGLFGAAATPYPLSSYGLYFSRHGILFCAHPRLLCSHAPPPLNLIFVATPRRGPGTCSGLTSPRASSSPSWQGWWCARTQWMASLHPFWTWDTRCVCVCKLDGMLMGGGGVAPLTHPSPWRVKKTAPFLLLPFTPFVPLSIFFFQLTQTVGLDDNWQLVRSR